MLLHDPVRAFLPYPHAPVPHAPAGPLAGLSFGVKDLFDVAGYPTGGGSPLVLARSGLKSATAPAVQALLDAGARFAGKTVTDELAFSINGSSASADLGKTRTPLTFGGLTLSSSTPRTRPLSQTTPSALVTSLKMPAACGSCWSRIPRTTRC